MKSRKVQQRLFASLVVASALTLVGTTTGCKKKGDDTETPGGAGGPGSQGPISKQAKEDFSKAVKAYEAAMEDGKIADAECNKVASAFEAVYKDNKKSMRIAYFNAAVIREGCGEAEQAEKMYEELAKTNYHLALNNLGVLAWNRGETKKALDYFQKSVKADPKGAFAARNNLAAAHRDRFAEKVSMEDFKTAEKQIQNVLAVDTSNKTAYENLARLYYDRGRLKDQSYLVLANLVVTQAIRVLKKEGTESADIYNLKGLLLMQDANQVEALKAFKKAVEVSPQHVDANLNIAFISIRFRAYDQAEKSLTVALKDPAQKRNVEAYIAMAVAKRGLKKFKASKTFYDKASKVDSKDPRPWYNLGILNQEHLIGQDDITQAKLEEYYNVAKKHYNKFIAMADSNKDYAKTVQDAKDRIVIIDDAIATFRVMEELEKKAKELEKQEKAAEAAERKRLLELEKKAMEASSAPAPAADKPEEKKK